jgi:hypothetical protein
MISQRIAVSIHNPVILSWMLLGIFEFDPLQTVLIVPS